MTPPLLRGHWPWLPFVALAHVAALVPGFLLGGALAWSAWRGGELATAYLAISQAHGHAQLVGWGGAMILGVALHFLPRLRGSRLAHPRAVPPLFALFAVGLVLRVGGPAWGAPAVRPLVLAGSALELVAAAGLVYLLGRTIALGPVTGGKRAFRLVQPLLAGALLSLLLALGLWTAAAWRGAPGRPADAAVDPRLDALATELSLEGFVVLASLAFSSRLFGLFFRVRPPHPGLLRAAGGLVGAGLTLVTLAFLFPPGPAAAALRAAADLVRGLGILVGIVAVRVFASRVSFPGDREGYRVLRDPAGLGALTAYVWAGLAGVALVLSGLQELGWRVLPGAVTRDLVFHALGAGFMILLILAVAPVLLPGFAGGRLRSPSLVAWSVALGNLAAALRAAPGWATGFGGSADAWGLPVMAMAGLAGLLAVALLAADLGLSMDRRPRAA